MRVMIEQGGILSVIDKNNIPGISIRENGVYGVKEIVTSGYEDKPAVAVDVLGERMIVMRRVVWGNGDSICYWADKNHFCPSLGINYDRDTGFIVEHPALGKIIVLE